MPRLLDGFQVAQDAEGAGVSGAKLTLYEVGTTTPVTTYTDEGLTIAHASPVIADAEGAFPAVYVGSGTYKVGITDAADVDIPGSPWDNVVISDGVRDVIFADVAAVQAATIASTVKLIRTLEYVEGRGVGGASYKFVGAEPSHPGKIQSADGAWWEIAEAVIRPEMVNVVSGTGSDQQSAFQSWITTVAATDATGEGTPGATYRLDTGVTVTASGVILRGNGATIDYREADADGIEITGTRAAPISDVEVSGWTFDLTSGLSHAIYVRGASRVRVRGNRCTGGRFFRTWLTSDSAGLTGASWDATRPDIAAIVVGDMASDIEVSGNTITGASTSQSTRESSANASIGLGFCQNARVFGNQVQGDRSGILWYGGDANPSRDGGYRSVRWARRLAISGNTVRDMALGGIWGSQGQEISATGNVVEDCLDICLHGEGDQDCAYVGNALKNGKNGCLTPYFVCENTIYEGNTSVLDSTDFVDPSGRMTIAKLNSAVADIDGASISFVGNTFECRTVASGLGVIEIQRGQTVRFSGNTFINCRYFGADTAPGALVLNNVGDRIIEGNHFHFVNDPSAAFDVIRHGPTTGKERLVLRNNTVLVKGFTPAAGSRFCYINNNSETENIIEGNFVPDFDVFLVSQSTSSLGSDHGVKMIRNLRKIGSQTYDLTDGQTVGATIARHVLIDDGAALTGSGASVASIWSATPTSATVGLLARGSRGFYNDVAAAGKIGWVCTTSGGLSSGAWSGGGTYVTGNQVTGSNSKIYRAIADGGEAEDPTTDTNETYWIEVAQNIAVIKDFGAVDA